MTKPSLLVAGGAGYIGAHFCKAAARAGFAPVVLDRLSSPSPRVESFRRESVKDFPLEPGDFGDAAFVRKIINQYKPAAAVCFAALIEVKESMEKPDLYWDNNFTKAARFFEALQAGGVNKLVFSSTAAVYGTPRRPNALKESDPLDPINVYGMTKLGCEVMLQSPAASPAFMETLKIRAGGLKNFPRINSVAFRYFNAAGAGDGLGEMHEPETHLLPNALFAAESMRDYAKGKPFTIFGNDYPTHDGTAVRDYIHVTDLAEAHVAGLQYLLKGGKSDVFNLGTGKGYSVREVVDTVRKVTGRDFAVADGPRREGDPPVLVADTTKAASVLGWQPKISLEEMVKSAHAFHKIHK